MTAYNLIYEYERRHPDGKFFSRENMKWSGEHFSEMRVLKKTAKHAMCRGDEPRECYVLSVPQHNAPNGGCRAYHYFAVDDFSHMGTDHFCK